MTIDEKQNERIIRLLKKDNEHRKYIREYMKQYRDKKKLETGIAQIQYNQPDQTKKASKAYYNRNTALNCIKYLFIE